MGAFGYVALPDSDSEVDLNGLAFSLGFGYRINSWFGIALEQDLGGLFYDKNHLDIDWFYGATMFEAKFFPRFGEKPRVVGEDRHWCDIRCRQIPRWWRE